MPKIPTPLTDTKIRQSRPKDKPYMIADGEGLNIRIDPTGKKWWVCRVTGPDGKRSMRQIGGYPAMTLAAARESNLAAQQNARLGLVAEPVEAAPVADADNSFTRWSEDWLQRKDPDWGRSAAARAKLIVRTYLQPEVGQLDVKEIGTKDIADVVYQMALDTPALARSAVSIVCNILDLAVIKGVRDEDRSIRTRGLLPKAKSGHLPAVTRESSIGELLLAIQNWDGMMVRVALWMCAWTAMRPAIVASARWDEVDLDNGEWHVPADRMKTRHDHIVSLPRQAIEQLSAVQLITGEMDYVFMPMGKSKLPHLHRDSLSKALRTMGFSGQHCTHGFRAMLRTIGRERLGIPADVLEAQLAHSKGDQVQAAYDRTRFDEERRSAMQRWADYLDAKLADASADD